MPEVTIPPFKKLQKIMPEPPKLRRSSTCFLGNGINEANVLPNYLRASIGSCHDFCKYGFKPDFQTIARTPTVKGSTAAPLPKKSMEPAKDDLALLKKKSSSYTSRTPSSILGASTGKIEKHEIQLPTTRKAINPKLPEELKKKPLRSKESSVSTTKKLRKRNTEISTLKGVSNSTGQKSAMSTAKVARIPKTNKETRLPTKTASSLSPRCDATGVPKKVSHIKGNKNISLASAGLQTRKPDAKITPKKVSSLKSLNSHNKAKKEQSVDEEEVPEKIIYVVETSTQNSKDLSSEEREQGKQHPSSVLLPEVEVPKSPKLRTISDNRKASAGKEHQSQSPRKLKFKKTNGTETQSEKNSVRIRLKFRQATLLALENQHKIVEVMGKKSTRKQDTKGEPIATTNEVNELVLRPQNPTEKEHTQSLYNNVIKETARKLVSTRKSKVKALVGAFETIISLQDEKSQGKTKA